LSIVYNVTKKYIIAAYSSKISTNGCAVGGLVGQSGDFIARAMDALFKIKAPHKTRTTPEKLVSVARVLVGKPQTGTRDYGQGGFRAFIRIWQDGLFNYLGCVSESDY